jgi:hypothetical protein
LILIFNLVIYRLDSFLYNWVDSALLIAYNIFIVKSLKLPFNNFFLIVLLPVIVHVSYMICYIINDIMDYGNAATIKNIDNLFYTLRPIYYFKRSKSVIAWLIMVNMFVSISLFALYPFLYSAFATFLISVTFLSFIHSSTNERYLRIVTFAFLRSAKYIFLLSLFNVFAFGEYFSPNSFYVFIMLIFPFTIYRTIKYATSNNILLSSRSKMVLILLLFLIIFGTTIHSQRFTFDFLPIYLVGHLLITLPDFCLNNLISIFLKKSSLITNYYKKYLFGLSLAVLSVIIEAMVVIYFVLPVIAIKNR